MGRMWAHLSLPVLVAVLYVPLVLSRDVIIVGAGISGLAAARSLVNSGHNATILEANPSRYGGRIWTNKQALPNAKGMLIVPLFS